MGLEGDLLLRAAKRAGCKITVLRDSESDKLKKTLLSKYYSQTDQAAFFWEGMIDDVGVYDPECWKKIPLWVGEQEAVMWLADESSSERMFLFQDGESLLRVLAESNLLDYYITDRVGSYLLCESHHHYLFGAGTAKYWVNLVSITQEICEDDKES